MNPKELSKLAHITVCPICKNENTSVVTTKIIRKKDNYGGYSTIIPMESECSSRYQIRIGFHKGHTRIFTRITKTCLFTT